MPRNVLTGQWDGSARGIHLVYCASGIVCRRLEEIWVVAELVRRMNVTHQLKLIGTFRTAYL